MTGLPADGEFREAAPDVARHRADPAEGTAGCVRQPQSGFHAVSTLPVATHDDQSGPAGRPLLL